MTDLDDVTMQCCSRVTSSRFIIHRPSRSTLHRLDVLSLRGGQCPGEASGHCPPLKHPFVAHVRGLPAGSYVSLDVLCVSSDRKYPRAVHQDE